MQGENIKVKDLRQGMRVVEYGYGRRIISTVLEDARRVDEDRGEEGHYDGWEARVRTENTSEPREFCYFECVEGSPYGPRLYKQEQEQEQEQHGK